MRNSAAVHDCFAIFDLPRSPTLDLDALREEFHRRSAALHPDAGGDAKRFAQLNAAYQTLRDPAARLAHLLQLETPIGLRENPPVPARLGDAFMRVAASRQRVETHLRKHRAATSPLTRAVLAGDIAARQDEVARAVQELDRLEAAIADRLGALEHTWREALDEIAAIHAELSYVRKWRAQLRELRLALDLVS